MDDFESKVQKLAQDVYDQNSTSDQFSVSQTPFHKHNGTDSPRISFINLSDVPTSYYKNAGNVATVNSTETGLIFAPGSGGGGDMTTAVYDPAGIDEQLLGVDAVQTITNKTISGASNTITNIGNASLINDSVVIGTTSVVLGATASTIAGVILKSDVQVIATSTGASGTITFDMSTGNIQNFTFSGSSASDSVTFALSNVAIGQVFIINITQNSGGSGTVSWFSTIRWTGGGVPTLTTTANKRDTLGFICTGSGTFDAYVVGQDI